MDLRITICLSNNNMYLDTISSRQMCKQLNLPKEASEGDGIIAEMYF